MTASRSRRTEALVFAGVVAAAIVVLVAVSLALRPSDDTMLTVAGQTSASPAASSASAQPSAAATGEPQLCASCWGDGGPDPTVPGEAEVVDGVQVVRVGVEGGYYVPNEFTVAADMPVTVIFSGPAEGCLAEPEFPDLGVKADFSGGSATMELGMLAPGSYPFTCSMAVNEGHITVE
jgi:hypothetical protein